MANYPKFHGGATRDARTFDRLPQMPEDLLLLGIPPVNLMITGPEADVQQVLETLLSDLPQPIACWSPGERLVLPSGPAPAMMILHEVGALPHDDQLHLLEWLERDIGRKKVVSTTAEPLMPLVEAGGFNDTLYYRLNTVSVEISA